MPRNPANHPPPRIEARPVLYVLCLTDSLVCGCYDNEADALLHLQRLGRDGHTGAIARALIFEQADNPRPPQADPPSPEQYHQ